MAEHSTFCTFAELGIQDPYQRVAAQTRDNHCDQSSSDDMRTKPRIKICCIASLDEAQAAISCGASALGLVSSMPSGPGVTAEETIAEIVRQPPPPIATFLLTSFTSADEIIAQQRRCGTNTLQLCDY